MRTLLLAVASILAAAAASSASAAPPKVGKLVLEPTQVGDGFVLVPRRDGVGVHGTVTMDLCGTDYASEKLRVSRLQVDYLKQASTFGLSNEVVVYKAGGAVQAMREALTHALTCPHHAIRTAGLPPLRFTITRISDSRLLKGYLAVRVRVTGRVQGKRVDQTSYAVYQRLGNVLSGVYSFGPATKAQLRFCLHAAEESARNLRLGGRPGGPTA